MDNIGKCLYCGIEIITKVRGKEKRFCGKICRDRYRHRQEKKQYTYICKKCGKEFHPKDIRRNQYCSNKCRIEKGIISDKIKIERLINKFIVAYTGRINTCINCGKLFVSNQNIGSEFCSLRCYYYYNNSNKHNESTLECVECGAKFIKRYGEKRRVFCSSGCSKRFNRRNRKVAKRAGKNNSIINRFSLYQILVRDGYRCGICGKLIDVSLPFNHKMSATIDHINPLSKGGSHCWNNVCAAHLSCNSRKGNRCIE